MKKIIIHCCHHKTGTSWFRKILSSVAKEFNLTFQCCEQDELNKNTDIWLEEHAKVDFNQFKDYVASHMIRDPRDVIISGYFYHKKCSETWCTRKRENGRSYQEELNLLDKDEGIMYEMNHFSKFTISAMNNWNYSNSRCFEIKYEDYFFDVKKFKILFKKYGFTNKEIKKIMKIVKNNHFLSLKNKLIRFFHLSKHLRKGLPGDWKNHFTEEHKKEFKRLFGDVLVTLGYEKDNSW